MGRGAVGMRQQERRTGFALIFLALPAQLLAAAPRTLGNHLLGSSGNGILGRLDGLCRGLRKGERITLPAQPVYRSLPAHLYRACNRLVREILSELRGRGAIGAPATGQ